MKKFIVYLRNGTRIQAVGYSADEVYDYYMDIGYEPRSVEEAE